MNASAARVARRMVPAPLRRTLRRCQRRFRPATIRFGAGAGLRFDPGPSNPAYANGANELPVQEAMRSLLQPGGVLYDIGANVGFFSVIGSRLAGPRGRVYAFEPVPGNIALIRRNVALNGLRNVEVVPVAVSDRTCQAELVLAAYSGGAALSTAPRPPDATSTLMVDATSIDRLVFDAGMAAPTVVKIDVEGAEMEVLRGMARTCAEYRPAIVCEIDAGTSEELRSKHEACAGFLRELGYQVRDLDDSYAGGDWMVGHLVATPVVVPLDA